MKKYFSRFKAFYRKKKYRIISILGLIVLAAFGGSFYFGNKGNFGANSDILDWIYNRTTRNLYLNTNINNVGIGSTTPWSKLTIYGDLFIEGDNRYIDFGHATTSDGYGFRDNSGTMEYKNFGGSWAGIGTGGGGLSAHNISYHSDVSTSTLAYGHLLMWDNTNWQDTSTSSLGISGTMTYPAAGIALSTGAAWAASITNNSANWNTAYGWGNHAGLYDITGQATSTLGTHTTTYNHANYDTAYGWGNHASAGYLLSSLWYATTTDGLAQGLTNKYYDDALVNTLLNASSSIPNTATLPLSITAKNISISTAGTWSGNAGTASALAADPTDCGANTWATTIASSGNLTCSAVTYAGITAMTSANFSGLISDETGTDKVVFSTSPTLVTPILGYASSTQLTISSTLYLGTATTTGSNGINISDGCFAIDGVCLGAGGVAESDPVWTAVSGNYLLTANAFTQAMASTTFVARNDWTTHDSYPAACTNQFIRQIGDTNTCASVANTDLVSSTISGVALGSNLAALTNDATLSGSSYDGSAAISDWGLNLANPNIWTGLQQFGNASTTQLSVSSTLYLGTATTTGSNGINISDGCFAIDGVCVGGTGGSGTVTSVAATVPIGMKITGSPITTSGTLGFNYDILSSYIPYGGVANALATSSSFYFTSARNELSMTYASTTAVSATTFHGALVGNASTATALAGNGANCNAGNSPLGVDASGAVETCFDVWTEAENTSAAYTTVSGVMTGTFDGVDFGNGTLAQNAIWVGGAAAIPSELALGTPGTILASSGGSLAYISTSTITVSGDIGGTLGALTISADAVDDTHIDWGTGAGQVSIADLSGNQISGALVWDFSGVTSLEIPQDGTVDATGEIKWDTTTGNLQIYNGTEVRVFQPFVTIVGTYSTSTWTSTTTKPLAPAMAAGTVTGAYCETDAGTVGVSLYDGTNRANYIQASTTKNWFDFTTNNTFTAGESMRIDFGTPASTPHWVACRLKFKYSAD